MEQGNNVSYIFIPFSVKGKERFDLLMSELRTSEVWAPATESDTKYMLKYMADKLNCEEESKRLCFHYCLREEGCRGLGLGALGTSFAHQDKANDFRFRFLGAHLYCFSTTVCIIALKLCIEAEDPLDISNAQYYLKKVSRCQVAPVTGEAPARSILELSKLLVAGFSHSNDFDFFFYAEPDQERANLLTRLEVTPNPEGRYDRELFYLRRCYSKNYLYRDGETPGADEVYLSSPDIQWGISPEAAVCITCAQAGHEEFVRTKFSHNFNTQYLFMYVLLLHQKYMLYLLLTQVNAGIRNDLQTMEEYQRRLYEFQMNFFFTRVTEVPQYQELYSRIFNAFSLPRLFEDVQNPLVSLSEMRQRDIEKQQQKRDKSVNKVLILLSILSFVSVLVDGFAFGRDILELFFGEPWVRTAKIVLLCAVCLVGAVVFRYIWRSTRD